MKNKSIEMPYGLKMQFKEAFADGDVEEIIYLNQLWNAYLRGDYDEN